MMVELYCGDCLQLLPQVASNSIDVLFADPPYGCGKATWDTAFPTKWYNEARRVARTIVIITGSSGLKDSIALVGNDFIDVVAAWNLNSLTRGPLGFNNWLAAVIAGHKPKLPNQPNFFEFAIRGKMPDHPTPKPIEYMTKLIAKLTKPDDVILDPFMGSGTTGVACVRLKRNFIGIEIDPTFFDMAQQRIQAVQAQLSLF